jgi:hypothetical protein
MPNTKDGGAPTLSPTPSTTSTLAGSSRPDELTVARILAAGEPQRPTLFPPGTAGASEGAGAVTGTWSTVTVDATWSIDETRNAFFHVSGGAWKKVFNGTDGAFTTLVALIGQAKQTGHQIAIREEADGLVHEVYLW